MGLNYKSQDAVTLIGSKASDGTRTGIALTTAYQSEGANKPTKSFESGGYSKVVFHVLYGMGSAETSNSIEVKLENSLDGTNWYSIANDSTSGATSTLTQREFTFVGANGTTRDISIFMDIAYPYMRISCKETGVASNAGNVFVEATLSGF